MKKVLFLCFTSITLLNAQNAPILTKGRVGIHNVFYPDSLKNIENAIVTILNDFPEPAGTDKKIKALVSQEREKLIANKYKMGGSKRAALPPMVISGFSGATNSGTPNDNNMAFNNDSFVISVLNTNIRVYNKEGKFKKNWTLEFFPRDAKNTRPAQGVNSLNRSYDPKIVFDPIANKFILIYLEGDGSNDTRIIVAFTKTASPLDGWNVYQLNGNPFGGTFWTDYPMIAINKEDLFITVNILKDNTDWRSGFTQSVIWQIPKNKGYAADSLPYNLWSNITFNNKAIWNICPVQEAFVPETKGLFLLSVRPGDAINDTVFLHHITDNWSSGNAQISYKVLKNNKQYGLPPASPQKQAGFMLQTNDARVLGAYYSNGTIQYVQTSRNTINGRSSIFHGVIEGTHLSSPAIKGNIISSDSLDFAYPTIAYAGAKSYGFQSLITFSHNGSTIFPGTSIIYHDAQGNYSDLVRVKSGLGYINSFIPDSFERWGDYTCIQRSYTNDKEYWLSGSFGQANNTVSTWVSKINIDDPKTSVSNNKISDNQLAYPNPVIDMITLPFTVVENELIDINIIDANGKNVLHIQQYETTGNKKAFINLSNFAVGIYFYTIINAKTTIKNGSFSKQ